MVVHEIIGIKNGNKDPTFSVLERANGEELRCYLFQLILAHRFEYLINSTFAISLGNNHCVISSWQAFSVNMPLRNLMILHIQSDLLYL